MTGPFSDGSLGQDYLRERIDSLDRVIANLLEQRADISAEIQMSRVSSGGARVDISREREVIGTYVEALGREGSDVAHTVLVYCRGANDAVPCERAR